MTSTPWSCPTCRARAAWGIVSSIDLARVADELQSLSAADVASTELTTIPSNESLQDAAAMMAEHGVTHLIVVQPDTGRPAGMISSRGLAAAIAYGRS